MILINYIHNSHQQSLVKLAKIMLPIPESSLFTKEHTAEVNRLIQEVLNNQPKRPLSKEIEEMEAVFTSGLKFFNKSVNEGLWNSVYLILIIFIFSGVIVYYAETSESKIALLTTNISTGIIGLGFAATGFVTNNYLNSMNVKREASAQVAVNKAESKYDKAEERAKMATETLVKSMEDLKQSTTKSVGELKNSFSDFAKEMRDQAITNNAETAKLISEGLSMIDVYNERQLESMKVYNDRERASMRSENERFNDRFEAFMKDVVHTISAK